MNKKAFTLVEILAVIIIIGIIGIIAVPTVSQYIKKSSDTTYQTYEHSMEKAAENMVAQCLVNNDDSCMLPDVVNSKKSVYLSELIDEGLIDEMKSPDTREFCESDISYVEIKKTGRSDYEYVACLYCGDYTTQNAVCTTYSADGEDPVCGTVTGASTRWTRNNRTISVGCSDTSSGCTNSSFSKTFNNTTTKGNITIVDNSGRTTNCEVDVYVDKTAPTCTLEIEGEYLESVGWYADTVSVRLSGTSDAHSGVLTYGLGTSINDRDYNKKTAIEVGRGITTVIGYVKDNAGNEGICSVDVRVGAGKPEFSYSYGYPIYPRGSNDAVQYTLSGITASGNDLTTTTTTPTITISDLSKYKDVEEVKIILGSGVPTATSGKITSGGMTKTATMSAGSREITFKIPKNTYNSLTIQLGELSGKTYDVTSIEVFTSMGDIKTNKNVKIEITAKDVGIRTTKYSFDNGSSWQVSNNKYFDSNKSSYLMTENELELQSNPVEFNISGIDKVLPTCTLKLEGTKNSNNLSYVTDVTVSFDTHGDLGGSGERRYGIGSSSGDKVVVHSSNSSDEVTYTGYIEDHAGNLGTCVAKFIKNSILTVTYDSNGGEACNPTTKAVTYNQAYGELCTPTRTGYTFGGWYTAATGGTVINSTTTVTAKGNHTIYAHWTANTYTISYALNNGTAGDSAPESGTYDSVLTINNPTKVVTITVDPNGTGATVDVPASEAQTFAGWTYTNGTTSTAKYGETNTTVTTAWSNGTTKVTNEFFKNLRSTSGTVTMTANWTPVEITVPTVINNGYICTLNTKANGTGTSYELESSYLPTANSETSITLFVICTKQDATVTFDVNGGDAWSSSTCTSPSTFTSSGKKCTKKVTYGNLYGDLPVPTKTNNVFSGWYTASTGGSKITGTSTVNISENTTYYAHWSTDNSSQFVDVCASFGARTDPWDSDYCVFSGLNPDNYVKFNNKMYRIVNVYKANYATTGKIQMKIMYNGNDITCTNSVPFTNGTASDNKCYYKLNNANGTYYKSIGTDWKAMVDTSSKKFYYGKVHIYQDTNKNITDTIAAEKTAKGAFFAGLLSVSDYVKASDVPQCADSYNGTNIYWSKLNTGTGSANACKFAYCCSRSSSGKGNWIYNNGAYGLHLINYYNDDRVSIIKGGTLSNWSRQLGHFSYDQTSLSLVGKPVHLLKDSVRVISGSGTSSDPYILATVVNVTLNNNGATTTGSTSTTAVLGSTKLGKIALPQKSYTVSFKPNSQNANIDSTSDLTIAYSFGGWYTGTGSSASKVAGNTVTPALEANVTDYTSSDSKWTRTTDATLYAHWSADNITLRTISKTGNSCLWNTKADGSGTNYKSGQSVKPTSNWTLYAWCKAVTFNDQSKSVYYNSATAPTVSFTGATGGIGTFTYAIKSQKLGSTAVSAFTLSGTTLTVAKGTAVGDYEVVITATDGTSGSKIEATITVTVKYPKLTLHKNDGTTASLDVYTKYGTTNEYTAQQGSTAATITASRTGYSLAGWYTSASGGTKVLDGSGNGTGTAVNGYTNASKQWVMTAAQELYAQWSGKTYTISYDVAGGTNASGNPTSGTYGAAVTINAPTKTGYKFAGWTSSTSNGLSSTAKAGSSAWTGTATTATSFTNLNDSGETVKLTATWTPNVVTIQYYLSSGETMTPQTTHTNGTVQNWTAANGTYGLISKNGTLLTQTIDYGGSLDNAGLVNVQVSFYLNITKSGYHPKNDGEWVNKDNTSKVYDMEIPYSASDFCDASNGDCTVTLKVNWEDSKYIITLNNKGATTAGTDKIYEKYGDGFYLTNTSSGLTNKMTTSANPITVPTKTNYVFDGYYTAENGGGTKYINANGYLTSSASNTNFTAANSLYANWVQSYTISYTKAYGTLGTYQPTTGFKDQAVRISNPTKSVTVTGKDNGTGATISDPVTTTQAFAGWKSTTLGANAKRGNSSGQTTAWDGSTAVTNQYFKNLQETGGAVTMVATWTEVEITLPTVTKTNYRCEWNTKADGTGTSYASGGTYKIKSGANTSINMYAFCYSSTVTPTVSLSLYRGWSCTWCSSAQFDVTESNNQTKVCKIETGENYPCVIQGLKISPSSTTTATIKYVKVTFLNNDGSIKTEAPGPQTNVENEWTYSNSSSYVPFEQWTVYGNETDDEHRRKCGTGNYCFDNAHSGNNYVGENGAGTRKNFFVYQDYSESKTNPTVNNNMLVFRFRNQNYASQFKIKVEVTYSDKTSGTYTGTYGLYSSSESNTYCKSIQHTAC